MHTHAHTYLNLFPFMHTSMNTYIFKYAHEYIYIYIYTHIYMYILIYAYANLHIFIYMFVHTYLNLLPSALSAKVVRTSAAKSANTEARISDNWGQVMCDINMLLPLCLSVLQWHFGRVKPDHMCDMTHSWLVCVTWLIVMSHIVCTHTHNTIHTHTISISTYQWVTSRILITNETCFTSNIHTHHIYQWAHINAPCRTYPWWTSHVSLLIYTHTTYQ